MSDKKFRLLLDLWMVSDPWPLSDQAHTDMTEWLRAEAIERGYDEI